MGAQRTLLRLRYLLRPHHVEHFAFLQELEADGHGGNLISKPRAQILSAKEEFQARILRAIDRGLEPIGESAKRSLYLHARRKHKLNRYEIPERPSQFSKVLEEVYGRSALGIERRIVEAVRKEFALSPTPASLGEAVILAAKTLRFE